MNSSYLTTFSRALLTGVFAGISATFVCIIYNVIFRDETSYQLFNLINVSSLIFGVNIAFMLIGIIYYWFIKFLKRGEIIYIGVFILITILGIVKTSGIQRTDDVAANIQFHHLFIAMIVIWSMAASIGIPVLFHSKRFEEHVL
jgi:hypothetical protein